MKITNIEPWLVASDSSPWGEYFFLRVSTDEGIVGWGEITTTSNMANRAVADIIKRLNELLVGENPLDIERLWNKTFRSFTYMGTRGATSHVVSGIDIALWDILGKAAGMPLYKLWGGDKDKVIPYASMVLLSTPEERAAQASSLSAQGWQAMKVRLHHETIAEDIRTIEAIREAVGDEMTLMADGNQAQSSGDWQPGVQWNAQRAYETASELQDMNVYWLEEPLTRYNYDGLAELSSKVEIPIAGGENNPGVNEFVQICEQGVYSLLQPESMVMNGLTNLRKIGVLAELYGKEIVPHHGGGNIGVIAHMHLVASWRHAPFMELLHDPPVGHYRNKFSIMSNAPEVDSDGFMSLPQGPGLGIEIDPDLIMKN